MNGELLVWGIFSLLILGMLFLDLVVFHREEHEVSLREALIWTGIWIVLGLLFSLFIYTQKGLDATLAYLAGYLVEKSLSLDNIFVFQVIFTYFAVPAKYRHKILFWGVVGALVMRGVFIVAGVTLIKMFHWVVYLLGLLLVYTGIRMVTEHGKVIEPERNPVIRLARRLVPMTSHYEGGRFFVRKDGRLYATPLLAVLLVVESTDVVFAVDSIPAIMALTTDPVIIYTSNVFALLGLRALYFALSGLLQLFHYLNYGLSVILVFVGVKMLISGFYKIPTWVALLVVVVTLTASIVASLWWPKATESSHQPVGQDG